MPTGPMARWKCTPSAAFGGVSPRESVSHDSHSPAAPYESCSLATPEGQILAALCDEMLMRTKAPRSNHPISTSKHSAARISPSGVASEHDS